MPPDLSFCIPTWNRAKWLDRCLRSIRSQPPLLQYEVWVRDNASTDETSDVFARIAAGEANWHIVRNESNFGAIANIRLCTESATAPYLMILGSDDALLPDAFARLKVSLELATEHRAAAILAYPVRRNPICWRFDNGLDWLRDVSINVPAFISSVVWRSNTWLTASYDFNPLSVYTLPHLATFIRACTQGVIIGCNGALVDAGRAEDTLKREDESPLYSRWPLMDCFEYPELYRDVFKSGGLTAGTWILAQMRRIAHFRHIPKKMALIQYNHNFFAPIIPKLTVQVRLSHGATVYKYPLSILAFSLERTALGRAIARAYCKHFLKFKQLTAADPTI